MNFKNILKIYMFVFVLKIRKIIRKDPSELSLKLLAFVLVFTSFGYIATVIPSGSRFQIIAFLASVLLFLRTYVKSPSKQLQKINNEYWSFREVDIDSLNFPVGNRYWEGSSQ